MQRERQVRAFEHKFEILVWISGFG
jgi:hypothetical protein